MSIIRPRINDYYNLPFAQADVDFVIPFIDEDIPLNIDPFLLWKSPSLQDNSLHLSLVNSFNQIGNYYKSNPELAKSILIECSECNEIGLGNSKTRIGKKIGSDVAQRILDLFTSVPQIEEKGIIHIEAIQLLVDQIGDDRISDITGSIIKSFLIDYTIDQCDRLAIPLSKSIVNVFSPSKICYENENIHLPCNPVSGQPIVFVPKRWLRRSTFIGFENYSREYYEPKILKEGEKPERIRILNFNRNNYGVVEEYIKIRERSKNDCTTDPLFKQIPVLSSKRKLSTILKLPTGKTDNADMQYEEELCPLLASLLYPHLDFATEQSRTESGVSIRDMIFYNNNSYPMLKDIYEKYECRQIIIELKNVKEISNDHIDQVNRYLKDGFGKFGIIFTRNPPPKKVIRNTVDLWSGQRKCILILHDEDLKLMCDVFESKNRDPIEVINKKYIEFNRLLPC